MPELKQVVENNINDNVPKPKRNVKMPWQVSTAGIVLGLFFGIVCCLIALLGNHQYKQGKDVSDLVKAYNIVFIITIIIVAITIILVIVVGIVAAVSSNSYYSYY
ncbi:MAG: hypothetical protein LBR40_00710 [Bacilli bacterium]|jgi:ABC-type amino acid transport system permease subunit|nr:hypothetical protein [Bacilli bacterium]